MTEPWSSPQPPRVGASRSTTLAFERSWREKKVDNLIQPDAFGCLKVGTGWEGVAEDSNFRISMKTGKKEERTLKDALRGFYFFVFETDQRIKKKRRIL